MEDFSSQIIEEEEDFFFDDDSDQEDLEESLGQDVNDNNEDNDASFRRLLAGPSGNKVIYEIK